LVRKNTITNTGNVFVVIKPSKVQVTNIKNLSAQKPPQAQTPKTPAKPQPQPQPQIANRQPSPNLAVSRQQLLKNRRRSKKTEVRQITRDIDPESHAKILAIKNRGRRKILVIVGNGPSITEAELERLVGNPAIEILSVNTPDPRLWPSHYWSFFDLSQFRRHESLWAGYNGLVFNSTAIKRQKPNSMQFKNHSGKGWSRDLAQHIFIGKSSVFASMQIAAWMGHEHVYVFGCDMSPEGLNGRLHFYGNNPDVKPDIRAERFLKEASYYDQAADLMSPDERAKFTFCSAYNRHGFVDKFNRLDHRRAVEVVLERAAQLTNPAF